MLIFYSDSSYTTNAAMACIRTLKPLGSSLHTFSISRFFYAPDISEKANNSGSLTVKVTFCFVLFFSVQIQLGLYETFTFRLCLSWTRGYRESLVQKVFFFVFHRSIYYYFFPFPLISPDCSPLYI